MDRTTRLFELAARLDRVGIAVTRSGLIVVLVWIGGLKVFAYEDEGIVPFVANSPVMRFFYRAPGDQYRYHMNREGELVPANREWHGHNGTYPFAYGLGSVIVLYGVLIALHPRLPRVAFDPVRCAFSSDGRLIASVGTDQNAEGPWDGESHQCNERLLCRGRSS